jgi:integrase
MPYKKDNNQKKVRRGFTKYLFNFTLNGKRYKRRMICSSTDVALMYLKWEDECKFNSTGESSYLYIIFAEYLENYSKQRKGIKQYKTEISFLETRLKLFFENDNVNKIKRKDIERFLNWRSSLSSNSLSRSTINKDLNILSSFFKWCIMNEYYSGNNPCIGLRMNENNIREIQLSNEEIQELFDKSLKYKDISSIIMIALYTGLRKTEILKLEWNDIDFSTQRLNVRAVNAKNNKPRNVPIPDDLANYLKPKTKLKVIGICEKTYKRNFTKLRDSLSFKNSLQVKSLHLHDLRHVYAQKLRDRGTAIGDIQAFLGHASPVTTTQRYAQSGGFDGVNKVNVLSELISGGVH